MSNHFLKTFVLPFGLFALSVAFSPKAAQALVCSGASCVTTVKRVWAVQNATYVELDGVTVSDKPAGCTLYSSKYILVDDQRATPQQAAWVALLTTSLLNSKIVTLAAIPSYDGICEVQYVEINK